MCCFSRPVTSVNATKIFARLTSKSEQGIVYQMNLDAPEDLAMILPIPVAQPTKDDAITFINLEGYKDFFKDMEKGFPKPRSRKKGIDSKVAPTPNALELEVHSVGAFDASFVPTTKDFHRLDERFRLPDGTWDQLPQYKNYGFAVFKLKKGRTDVHPMAFTFPTALLGRLYFPTVHIHDGKIHAKEKFDHVLYAQAWQDADTAFAQPLRSFSHPPPLPKPSPHPSPFWTAVAERGTSADTAFAQPLRSFSHPPPLPKPSPHPSPIWTAVAE